MALHSVISRGRRWQFGPFEYVEVSRKLFVGGKVADVEAKPLEVLLRLLENPNQVVSKSYLLEEVWPDVETTEQSLTTAISKLRKALGGARDSVILNAAGEGYRMAIPVTCTFQEDAVAPLVLQPGDSIPRRPNWRAIHKLSRNPSCPVWLARNQKTGEERVYKFALDGVRLRGLQREVTIFRLLTKGLGREASFLVPLIDWNFEDFPFFIESSYCGPDLLKWSETKEFQETTLERRIEMAGRLATSVASAHRFAVLHNDLKPTNLLVTVWSPEHNHVSVQRDASPNEPALRIADFGVASLQDLEVLQRLDISDPGSFVSPSAASSTPVGTEMYRAPECRAGESPTALNDIYAFGVLLYQLACNNFHEPPLPGWEQKISDPLLRQDIADAANVHPEQRIQTMAELANRLQNFKPRRAEKERQDRARALALQMEESLARTRMRRPWVIFAMTSLAFGLLATTWTAYQAVRQRDETRSRNAALESMYGFLAIDVLGQSNPYLAIAGSGGASQQTLLNAVDTAVPQIDSRFSQQPEIAARLHETIADTYKDRTRFQTADHEYAAAARHYREVGGELSQAAIIVELKRCYADIAAILPGSIQIARNRFAQQELLIARVPHPSPALQAWETLVKTALMGMGPHPEQTLPLIRAAVERAEATPGFDSALLFRLKKQFCGTYVRLGDGANLERVSREIIDLLTRQHRSDSPLLFPYQMYLEEAYFLQGKYPETVAQADLNFARFDAVLGRTNRLTLATLTTRAAAEGQMERYEDAVRDERELYEAERVSKADPRLEVGSLNDAATYECRKGDYATGIDHAREVMRLSAPGPSGQPMFFNGSMFTLAECLIGSQEAKNHRSPHDLDEASALLDRVDIRPMAETSDETAYEGARDVARARLAILRGSPETAKHYVGLAEPFLARPGADPYERRALGRLKVLLAQQR